MRFLPAIDLWGPMGEAVRTGQLQLLPGQWVRCGADRPSRWIGMSPHRTTMLAVHPHGDKGVTTERFLEALRLWSRAPLRPPG